MSLEFSASNILWHEFEKNNNPSATVESEQLDKVKSFVNAFFSHIPAHAKPSFSPSPVGLTLKT